MTREEVKRTLEDLREYKISLSDLSANEKQEICDIAISALFENKGEWIPVSERLPEDDTEVIYCDKNGVRGNCHYWKGFNRYPRDNGEYQFPNDIVAWMTLPEPYKENDT